jgi:hypothetical protein
MKKTIFFLALATTFMAGSLFTGCQTAAQKEEKANAQVVIAEDKLDVAQNNADAAVQKVATAEQFKTYKLETELKIKNNEVRIAELKLKIKGKGSAIDEVYANKIDSFELRNKDMQSRIDTYEKKNIDWETFKRKLNHDLDELGKSLKDLNVKYRN